MSTDDEGRSATDGPDRAPQGFDIPKLNERVAYGEELRPEQTAGRTLRSGIDLSRPSHGHEDHGQDETQGGRFGQR